MTKGRALIFLSAIGVLAAMWWYRSSTHQPQPPLPRVPIVIEGRERLMVEIAAQPVQRERGLMFRSVLPPDGGMLFVFPEATELAFWMKHTSLPLSIAFVSGDGHILNIEDMRPFDTTLHHSAGPAWAALEVSQGWFTERGIMPGDTVQCDLPSDLKVSRRESTCNNCCGDERASAPRPTKEASCAGVAAAPPLQPSRQSRYRRESSEQNH